MLSSVTLNCEVTNIVMNLGFQLSELKSVSQMSQVTRIVFVKIVKLSKRINIVEIVNFFKKDFFKEIIWANSEKEKTKIKDKII